MGEVNFLKFPYTCGAEPSSAKGTYVPFVGSPPHYGCLRQKGKLSYLTELHVIGDYNIEFLVCVNDCVTEVPAYVETIVCC